MFDAMGIYDYLADRQAADDMGFETVQELYEWSNNESERNRKSYLERNRNVDNGNIWNARFKIT